MSKMSVSRYINKTEDGEHLVFDVISTPEDAISELNSRVTAVEDDNRLMEWISSVVQRTDAIGQALYENHYISQFTPIGENSSEEDKDAGR